MHGVAMDGRAADLRAAKVRKYEEFIDLRLKPDLVQAIALRDKVFEQQKISSDLKRNIESLQKSGATSLRTMVNIGSEVYAQAEAPDTTRIFVDIGLGFFAEFTWPEALDFIPVREARLARQIEEYTHLIASIKAQIKLVWSMVHPTLTTMPLPAIGGLPQLPLSTAAAIHGNIVYKESSIYATYHGNMYGVPLVLHREIWNSSNWPPNDVYEGVRELLQLPAE